MYVQWLFDYYQINTIDKSQQDKAADSMARELIRSLMEDVLRREDRRGIINEVLGKALESQARGESKNDFIGQVDL